MIDPQPIKVIVEYAHGNTPEWVKTIITAAFGAVIGFVGSVGMEFVKLWVAKATAKRFIRSAMTAEVMHNRMYTLSARKMLKDPKPGDEESRQQRLLSLRSTANMLVRDRYDYFFKNDRGNLYRVDKARHLFRMYQSMREVEKAAKIEPVMNSDGFMPEELLIALVGVEFQSFSFLMEMGEHEAVKQQELDSPFK